MMKKDFIIVLAQENMEIFDFLMKTRSLKFGEAVKTFSSEAGMQIYRFSKLIKKKKKNIINIKRL